MGEIICLPLWVIVVIYVIGWAINEALQILWARRARRANSQETPKKGGYLDITRH